MMASINGTGVCRKGIRIVDTTPRRTSVTKSPRQEAIGGAILSGGTRQLQHKGRWMETYRGRGQNGDRER